MEFRKKILGGTAMPKICDHQLCSGSEITKVSPQPGLSGKYQPFARG